jgi:acetyl-CoA acetyltransferase
MGSLRGATAVAGIGQSDYGRWGSALESEFSLALRAIIGAVEDAGLTIDDVDGFTSYGNDRNEPHRLASALGLRELRFAASQFGGGGGGSAGHIGLAAAAIYSGMAECVVAFRACAQGQFGRFGRAGGYGGAAGGGQVSGYEKGAGGLPYGVMTAAQKFAFRATRLLEVRGVDPETFAAVSLAAYHHAQNNPDAVMKGRPLTPEMYHESRLIAEPFRLFDCCQESDAAAAVVLVSAERAGDLRHDPVYVLSAVQGSEYRSGASFEGENIADFESSGFRQLAPRIFADSGLAPADVDVVQAYDNFTAGVVMALVEHGFCDYESASEVLRFDNLIAPSGGLPLNTSGGNLAAAYILGMELHLEAVRQLRGTSSNQVPGAEVCLSIGGPLTYQASSVLFGTASTL